MRIRGIKYWAGERKYLKIRKRECMKRDFQSTSERKNLVNSFKKEYRAIKRGEKNEIKRTLRDKYGV